MKQTQFLWTAVEMNDPTVPGNFFKLIFQDSILQRPFVFSPYLI